MIFSKNETKKKQGKNRVNEGKDPIELSFPTTQLGGSSDAVNSEGESSHTEVAGMSMAH